MKPDRLHVLWAAAAQAETPKPEAGFEERVLRAVRLERLAAPACLGEQIARLLPRVAVAAGLVILAGITADLALAHAAPDDLSTSLTRLSEQWLFAVK